MTLQNNLRAMDEASLESGAYTTRGIADMARAAASALDALTAERDRATRWKDEHEKLSRWHVELTNERDRLRAELATALQQCANGARLQEAARLVPLLYAQLRQCSYLACSRPATHGSDTPDAACDQHVEWLRGAYSSDVVEWPDAADVRAAAAWLEATPSAQEKP
jgi:hypothetical protein